MNQGLVCCRFFIKPFFNDEKLMAVHHILSLTSNFISDET